jgi:type III pantothenate kinase
MLLCDIGNTSYHFYDGAKSYKESVNNFNPSTIKEKIYFISVNVRVKNILKDLDNWMDLSKYVDMSSYYETMGIDRVFACESVTDGIILDAGSAITVDIVKNGKFVGGFIYPGINAMSKTYKNISCALDYSFNFELDLDKMPKNSEDAISYGFLKGLYCEVMSHNMPVILTGGDSKKFKKIFLDAEVDEKLIFRGMKKIMKRADLC